MIETLYPFMILGALGAKLMGVTLSFVKINI